MCFVIIVYPSVYFKLAYIQDHDYDKPNFSISAIPTPTTPPVVSSPRLVAIADPVTPRVSNEKKVGGMDESMPAGAPQPAEKKLPRKQKKAKKLSKSKARGQYFIYKIIHSKRLACN